MNYRSYSKKELVKAAIAGETLWRLDTGNNGEDDILIGEYGDVVDAVLNYHGIETLPKRWELEEISLDVEDE